MNYTPNPIARRLSRGASETVALVVPAEPGRFYEPVLVEMLSGLGETLAAHGYHLMLMTARPGEEEEKVYRRLAVARTADAAIVVRTRVNDPRIALLAESGFPFVALGRSETPHRFAFIDGDAQEAFRAATERFIAQGHRRIGLLATSPKLSFTRYRRAGFWPRWPTRRSTPTQWRNARRPKKAARLRPRSCWRARRDRLRFSA